MVEPSASTPALLLDAARPLFATRGYRGASVREVTRRAGVNLGAVTYHFGSKEALYEEVVARALRPLVEGVTAAAEGHAPPARRLEAALAEILEHLRREPDLPSLLFQEVTAGEEPPRPVSEGTGALLRILAGLVREGKSRGVVAAGDPLLTATSLLAETVTVELLRRTVDERDAPGLLGRSAAGVESHVLDFTRRALGMEPGDGL